KERLQEESGLPTIDVPVIGIISRLVEQKGLDLVNFIMDELMVEDLQLVILGTGEKRFEDRFSELAAQYPTKIATYIKYDTDLAQKIYAGSDFFLMPSQYEPCGISQLISLRYGTIPIVRETGGLKDTIEPYNFHTDQGTGFTFSNYDAAELLTAIQRGIEVYHQPQKWKQLVRRAMECDFSWRSSAQEYIELYQKLRTN
ncbi:MAG: glycogen synthase, partial [Bacillota bacterium]